MPGTATADPTVVPELDGSTAKRTALLLGILFGLAGMGSAGAALALAPLAGAYDIGLGAAAWTISLYALMFGVGTAVYGRVADLQGPRFPMLVGLSLMTFGALVAALAPTFGLHLAGRLVQGAGAAAVPTLGAAILTARYRGAVRSSALLRLAGVAAAMTSLGPLAAGLLVDTLSWRLAIALPILGVLVVPFLWSSMHVGGTGARLDILGAVLTALAAGGVVLLLQSPSTGASVALAGAVLVVLGTPAVAVWVRRHPDGFLPLSVVRNPRVVRSALAAAAIPASWFALLVAIPAVLLADGWSAWQVGLALVPAGVVGLVTPRVAGPLLARTPAATALAFGAVAASVSLLVAALGAALESPVLLVVAVVLATISFGVGQPALTAAVGEAVAEDVRGVALGVATLLFMVGASVGSAVVGGLGPVLGLSVSILVLTALPAVGLILLVPNIRRPVSRAS
ncbi:MAG TPA: MFS transporter [Marmoricola sp.]|nr:MFS transporter [Marmoricola sp.]